jgi:cell wall-associated NlpC family hydrolase
VARRIDDRVLGARDTAMRQRGDAYAYGASGPDRFDCSGLVYYSFRRAGFAVPRTSGAQAGFTRRVAKQDMRPGDLMFFTGSGGVYHAAIFLKWSHGHAVMVHSPGSGERVRVAVPWTSSWFGGTLRRR